MKVELIELKKYLARKKVNKSIIGIDELPLLEGYCIYDARSTIEVFYYERGNKFDVKNFSDIDKAINYFKRLILSDPTSRM